MTRAFYSFHFANDAARAGQVRNMGAIEGDQIVDDNSWEKVKKAGDAGIKKWIDNQMSACDVVIVLVGSETASRPWVDYEIRRAWDTHKPVFGIRIHGLKNLQGERDNPGANPFESITLQGGGPLSEIVPLHNPAGTTSQDVYASISAKIKGWIKEAPSRRK
jgi:hypothetical protein